jgi:glycosyltransferase involved in cell wall biosynthesis
MKVLFNYGAAFSLEHGGAQIQLEETMRALNVIGVTAEPLRWWDDQQRGDILHHLVRPPASLVRAALQKGMKVVVSELLTGQGSRTRGQLLRQKYIQRFLNKFGPRSMVQHFNWDTYQLLDACIVLTPWEAEILGWLYNTPKEKIHVVPNGVETVFLDSQPAVRGPWLVCTATITERKRVLELAEAAVEARTPLWIVGKPYNPDEPYARRFLELARRHPDYLRYEGPISDRGQLAVVYREARGFVLLSAQESLSLSALEATACECPLLLSDLPWARTVFKADVQYCSATAGKSQTAEKLRSFYDQAPALQPPPKPMTWIEVAQQIKGIYEGVLNTSR